MSTRTQILNIELNETAGKANISPNRILLQLEGLAFLIAIIAVYASQNFSALAFILLLLVPDVAMLGYLINQSIGTLIYNLVHFYAIPLMLVVAGVGLSAVVVLQIGLIWLAHIAMDRTFGFGLKYADTPFSLTHFNRV